MLVPNSRRVMPGAVPGPVFPQVYGLKPPVDLLDMARFGREGHPWAAYAQMRDEAPACWHPSGPGKPSGFWALTRYRDIKAVSLDPRTFSSEKGGFQIGYGSPASRHPVLFRTMVDNIIALDGATHLQLRRAHMPFFTAAAVATLKKKVDAKIAELIDRMAAALKGEAERLPHSALLPEGQVDLVEYFSAELPLFTLCELLGVPREDGPKLVDWMRYLEVAQDTVNRMKGGAAPTAADIEFLGVFLTKVEELFDYGRAAMLARRAEPKDDLLSAIANARIDGEALPDEYLDGSWLVIFFAGNDTTRNTISGTLKLLTEHPAVRERVIANLALLPNMLDEAMRLVTPVVHMRRTATRTTEIAGQKIGEGEKVVMWYGGANRDPRVFPEPDRFDIERANAGEQMTFGAGVHVCIGKRVAQIQLEGAFCQLFQRLPRLAYAGGIDLAPNNFVVAIRALPVTLG